MNLKAIFSSVVIGIVAVACAQGVGAENPLENDGNPPDSVSSIATSIPATIPPVSVSGIAATVSITATPLPPQPAPTATPRTDVPVVAPTVAPHALATATPIRFNPVATPTPLWTPVPSPTAVPTIAPTPTATIPPVQPTVSAAPVELFSSVLNYEYEVPSGWSETRTESSIVITDPSGKMKVTISETPVDRWRYQTVTALGAATFPEQPSGWNLWILKAVAAIKVATAYEFQFAGEKGVTPYLQFVHWYLWGDVHVEVAAEVPSFDWSTSAKVRSDVQLILDSFTPHDGANLLTSADVLAAIYERLDDRPSGIYGRNEELRMRYELTCRDIYNDMVMQPEYLGNGLWQVIAPTLQSVETWWVFEPGASIMTLNSNQSRC